MLSGWKVEILMLKQVVHQSNTDFASVNFVDEMVCSCKPYGKGCRQRCFAWNVTITVNCLNTLE